jgi:hypothetical protein
MKCSRCHHDNRAGARFCEQCAESLSQTCGRCGGHLPAAAKFCPECAHPTGLASTAPTAPFGFAGHGMSTSPSELRAALAQTVTVTDDSFVVDLVDGRTVSVSLAWYPRLAHGTPRERANWP